MKKVAIFGVSGHAKVITDIIEKEKKFELAGFVDNSLPVGTECLGYKVIGNDPSLGDLIKEYDIFGGVIGIGDNYRRFSVKKEIDRLVSDFNFVNCIHPDATIGKDVTFGVGNVVMAGAIINPSSSLGNHCIVNTNSSLDHDCCMSDYSSIAPNAAIGGNVSIGEFSAIGIGANVFHQVKIGTNCVVGGGSLVTKDTSNDAVFYGSPCKFVRSRKLGDKYL